jgi:hypothetical protein
LRSKILSKDILSLGLNTFFKSNFPIQFLRFSIIETIFLLQGKHFLSLNFFKKKILIFSNKSFLNKVDNNFLSFLKQKINILLYLPSLFSNSSGVSLINFANLNFKELLFSKQVYGLALDDNFFLRKLLPNLNQFFWVNKLSADILHYLPSYSWLTLEINNVSGFFLNFEQRIQKYNLINKHFKFNLFNFIFFVKFTFFQIKTTIQLKYIFIFFNKFQIYNSLLFLQFLFESFFSPLNFYSYHFFLPKKFFFSFFFFFKKTPFKLLFEDSNRTSLQLKYSLPLIKSSQHLNLYDYLFFM